MTAVQRLSSQVADSSATDDTDQSALLSAACVGCLFDECAGATKSLSITTVDSRWHYRELMLSSC
jgi:hypothetical protein